MAFYLECYLETKRREKEEEKEEESSCSGFSLVRLTGLKQQSLCADETTVLSDLYNPWRKKQVKKGNETYISIALELELKKMPVV